MGHVASRSRGSVLAAVPVGVSVAASVAIDGSLIASGRRVWNGVIDDRPTGACTQRFPIYSSSRRQAGGP